MDVGKLFQGIAVIFDDELSNPTSTISKIKELIQNKNIPVAVYNEMPRQEIIPSLSNASFVILDWDYTNSELSVDGEERLSIPTELKNEQDKDLILFIRELLRRVFIPVFIFTSKSVDSIKTTLRDVGLWYDDKDNRIFIKQKNDINSEDQFFGAIEEWLKAMPSVYVLKEWENTIAKTKNDMFVELYGYSSSWVKIIWEMLKADSRENHREFGDFITKQLVNRVGNYSFEEQIINSDQVFSPDELSKVVEGERYISYIDKPNQAYTGDLFLQDNRYYLNIRAQCDLARERNPALYLIKGKELQDVDIVTEDIKLTSEKELHVSAKQRFSLARLCEICQSEEELIALNDLFRKHKNEAFFSSGNIIGKKSEVIIACVAGKKALKFRLDVEVKNYNCIKDKLIGRILPPYITCIQQSCANYIVREGTMPTPSQIFRTFSD